MKLVDDSDYFVQLVDSTGWATAFYIEPSGDKYLLYQQGTDLVYPNAKHVIGKFRNIRKAVEHASEIYRID